MLWEGTAKQLWYLSLPFSTLLYSTLIKGIQESQYFFEIPLDVDSNILCLLFQIAALSPADINYDETLSTLRYGKAPSVQTLTIYSFINIDILQRSLHSNSSPLL